MYKKLSLFAIALIISTLSFAQAEAAAEEAAQNDTVNISEDEPEILGIHPYVDEDLFSNKPAEWSLYIQGGFNVFDGDYSSEKKHAVNAPTVGIGFEYNFKPTWGIGAEYIFRQVKVAGKDNESTADVLLEGMEHQADAFLSFDIFNCWRSQNVHKLFSLDLIIGGGLVWFKNSTYYPNVYRTLSDGVTIRLPQSFDYHTKQQGASSADKYTQRGVLKAGASFDFNVSRSIAIGLRCMYNYFTKDDIDGRVRGTNNDGVVDVTALLRWKIQGRKHSHFRNVVNEETIYARGNYQYVNQNIYPGGGGHEKDTLVISHKDTLVSLIEQKEIAQVSLPDRIYSVYFDNNSSELTNQALTTLQEVAMMLEADPNLCVELIGYCDYTGNMTANRKLSWARTDGVQNELVDEYEIGSDRIVSAGLGAMQAKRQSGSFAANRRVEIRVMDRTKFEQVKEQLKDVNRDSETLGEKAARGENVDVSRKAVMASLDSQNNEEEQKEVQQETPAQEVEEKKVAEEENKSGRVALETVEDLVEEAEIDDKEQVTALCIATVKQGDTYQKLAKTFYDNKNCWIYIKQANRTCLGDKKLTPGMEVIIPSLTEDQQTITRKQAKMMADRYE